MNNNHRRKGDFSASGAVVTCKTCDYLLDAYLDAEIANADVRRLYPAIWRHLQTCPTCAGHYELLRKLLVEYRLHPSRRYPDAEWVDLPFLRFSQQQSVGANLPWHVYLRPQILGEPFLLRFSFSLSYVQNFIRRANACATRAAALGQGQNGPPAYLLLKEHIHLYEQEILARIVAFPVLGHSDSWQLKARLTSTKRLPSSLQAVLQWGVFARTCRVTASGEADLGSIGLDRPPVSRPGKSIYAVTFAASA